MTTTQLSDFATARPAPAPALYRAWRGVWTAWREARRANSAAVHDIGCNRILSVAKPLGTVVECLQGCVWITIDADRRDVVLAAGQTFTADRDDRALIQALASSRVRLSPARRSR
ncbi:MAG: DUF2917 domain-containing protein [Burkholderiaceae bacterium]